MQGMGEMMGKDGCVTMCSVVECSYNQDEECHAPGIQVGDSHPMCDTFTTEGGMGMQAQSSPDVTTCKVTDCEYNDQMDCNAQGGIQVDHHTGHADCSTYEPR